MPVPAGRAALQHHEARAGQAGRRLEIHQAQGLAQIEVLARLVVEGRPLAEAPHLDIVGFRRAVGHIVGRQVRQFGQERIQLGRQFGLARFEPRHLFLQARDLGDRGAGILAPALGLADRLGRLIAALLDLLDPGLGRTALGVERQDVLRAWRHAAAGEAAVEQVRFVPDESNVVHDRSLGYWGQDRRRASGRIAGRSAGARSLFRRRIGSRLRLFLLLPLASRPLGQLGRDDRDFVEQDHRDREADLADHVGRVTIAAKMKMPTMA